MKDHLFFAEKYSIFVNARGLIQLKESIMLHMVYTIL